MRQNTNVLRKALTLSSEQFLLLIYEVFMMQPFDRKPVE